MEFHIPAPYSNEIRGSAQTLNKQYKMSVKTLKKLYIRTGAPDMSEIPSQCSSIAQVIFRSNVFMLTLYGASYSNIVRGSAQTLNKQHKTF